MGLFCILLSDCQSGMVKRSSEKKKNPKFIILIDPRDGRHTGPSRNTRVVKKQKMGGRGTLR